MLEEAYVGQVGIGFPKASLGYGGIGGNEFSLFLTLHF